MSDSLQDYNLYRNFFSRYAFLRQRARLGTGARSAYGFLAHSLAETKNVLSVKYRVETYLVVLRRQAKSTNRFQQASLADQIAVFEQFLTEVEAHA